MKKSFNELKKQKKQFLGTFAMIPAPEVVELAAYSGFDFIVIDEEHTPWASETAINMVRAAEASDMLPLIRVPEGSEVYIKKALDTGASGIIVPNIFSPEILETAVRFAKFSPMGARGACPCVRANQYGAGGSSYYQCSNRDISVIALVEGIEGIKNFDKIIEVPNVDAIYLGPVDLSLSLGLDGDIYHPKVVEGLEEMMKKAKDKGLCLGIFCMDKADAQKWFDKGVDFVIFNTDTVLFYEKFKDVVDSLKMQR